MLGKLGQPVLESEICHTLAECEAAAEAIGLPVGIRPAYTLGGTGGGMASPGAASAPWRRADWAASPITQVPLEKNLLGWKEVEHEVMRDGDGNCITICNMENLDPMGVLHRRLHRRAPSQTLSDKDYQMLRTAALRIDELGIEGGCNVQFRPGAARATRDWNGDPRSAALPRDRRNPRVSRSSALASKATGYLIARVAAKIRGKRLPQIPNAVTQRTTAAFEPAWTTVW